MTAFLCIINKICALIILQYLIIYRGIIVNFVESESIQHWRSIGLQVLNVHMFQLQELQKDQKARTAYIRSNRRLFRYVEFGIQTSRLARASFQCLYGLIQSQIMINTTPGRSTFFALCFTKSTLNFHSIESTLILTPPGIKSRRKITNII